MVSPLRGNRKPDVKVKLKVASYSRSTHRQLKPQRKSRDLALGGRNGPWGEMDWKPDKLDARKEPEERVSYTSWRMFIRFVCLCEQELPQTAYNFSMWYCTINKGEQSTDEPVGKISTLMLFSLLAFSSYSQFIASWPVCKVLLPLYIYVINNNVWGNGGTAGNCWYCMKCSSALTPPTHFFNGTDILC